MRLAETIQRQYEAGKSLSEILESVQNQTVEGSAFDVDTISAVIEIAQRGSRAEQILLQRASIPRSFDRRDYKEVLGDGIELSFDVFTKRGDVMPALRYGSFCLTEVARNQALGEWKLNERKRFASRLARHYKARQDTMNSLVCLLLANPKRAHMEFLRLYRDADKSFDYATLDDLLCMLRDRQRHISPRLVRLLSEREQYYQSRVLYVDDWMKSFQFLQRPILLSEFQQFLFSNKHFLMNLHARGGAGKTAFLRWFVSHCAIVERSSRTSRTPTAKVDIDQIDVAAVRRWPWLLLVPVIRQLNQQLPGAPLETLLHRLLPIEDSLRRPRSGTRTEQRTAVYKTVESVAATLGETIYDEFAEQLGQSRCLVILDTVEEMMLHQPAQFRDLIFGLVAVRKRCTGFHLLISGRYPLNEVEACAEIVERLGAGIHYCLVTPFTKRESESYLIRLRGLTNSKLVQKIIRHSSFESPRAKDTADCSPFKLALFADLATTTEGLSKEDFRQPELAYLLRRIIDRVPEDELALRWTLRYAVVPRRQLDPEFFDYVLKDHLEREIALKTRLSDDPSKGLPVGFANPWKYVDGGQVRRQDLWEALRKYAGPRSWINFEGDVVTLQPELVQPMRSLLRQSQIFKELHSAACGYFEGLAESRPSEWARWTVEALYHRFQRDGPRAAQYWAKLLEGREACDLEVRRQLCELLVSGDFVGDDERPVIDPQSGTLTMNLPTLARARLELASVYAQRAQNMLPGQERGTLLDEMVRQFNLLQRLERRMKRRFPDPGRRTLIKASVALQVGQGDKVRRIAATFVAKQPQNPYSVPLLVLQAEAGSSRDLEGRSKLYDSAAKLASEQPAPLLSVAEIRRRQAQLWIDAGDLARAATAIAAMAGEVLNQPNSLSGGQAAVYAYQLEIGRMSGNTALSEEILNHSEEILNHSPQGADNFPLASAVFVAKAHLCLARGEAEYWLENSHWERTNDDEAAVHCIWRARALAELFHTTEAFEELDHLSSKVRNSRADLAEQLSLEKAAIALDVLGDRRTARSLLFVKELSYENLLRHRLLYMRSMHSGAYHALREEWGEVRRRLLPKLSHWEKTQALAQWIAMGRPKVSEWEEFRHSCERIQPVGARYNMLRPFLYSSVRRASRSEDWKSVFPAPRPGPDFLQQTLALASFYRTMRDRPFAQQLLRPAVSEFRSSNLVLMYRLMRVSRRCRLEIDHEFVTRCREGISTAQTRHPQFAAVAALELAYWLYLNDNGGLAAELLAEAISVASKAEYRFQGRYLTLAQSLNHKLGAERRGLSPELPLELPQHLLLDRRGGKIVALSSTEPRPPVDWDQLVWATLPRNLMLIVPDNLAGELLEANLNRSRPHGFRRAPAQGSDRHEAVATWFQSALFDAGYPIEITGRWSASDQSQLARFALERNIRRAKWIEWPAKQQLRIASKRPAKVLLICESFESERSHRQGYGAAGLDFLKETGLKNCRVWRVGDEPIHKINEPFDLIWITGFFEESSSGLALIMRERSNTLAFTPDQISRMINNRGPRPDLQPLVFLDAPDNPDRHRQARQRNQFAHSLYSLGAARSVLAAGLVEKDLQLYLLDLRHCLEKHASEGETAKKLSYTSIAPVLYSADPTIPIL